MPIDDSLPLGQILHGDCITILDTLPEKSVDLIFADPPYNLQGGGKPWQPGTAGLDAPGEEWDPPASYAAYDAFSRNWLSSLPQGAEGHRHAVGDRVTPQYLPHRGHPAGGRLLDSERCGVD